MLDITAKLTVPATMAPAVPNALLDGVHRQWQIIRRPFICRLRIFPHAFPSNKGAYQLLF